MNDRPDFIEPFGVPDVFVTGLGHAEHIGGGNWRFTFFVHQEVGGNREMVVAAKIIMPAEAVPAAMCMTTRRLSEVGERVKVTARN